MNRFNRSKFIQRVRSISASAVVTFALLIPAHSASYQVSADQSMLQTKQILTLATSQYAVKNTSSKLLSPSKNRYTLASVSDYVVAPSGPSNDERISSPKFSLFAFLTRLHDKIHSFMMFFEPSAQSFNGAVQDLNKQDKAEKKATSCNKIHF